MVVQVSELKPGLWDQLWAGVWSWLERHDSLAGAMISVGFGGLVTWIAWRAKKYRDKERALEAAAMATEKKLEAWRASVDQDIGSLKERATRTESAVRHVTGQLGEVMSRLGRIDERHRESEERSSQADERIEQRISETNAAVRDVNRGIQAILLRNRRVDSEIDTDAS